MDTSVFVAALTHRSVITVEGEDWRGFLQGLITQDVESLYPGDARFCGLLNPQGRLLFDLFVIGQAEGCLLDCQGDQRDALIDRLMIYRLRAKVVIKESDLTVWAIWGQGPPTNGGSADPRVPGLGWRAYGGPAPEGTVQDEIAYAEHVFALGAPAAADWGFEKTYPIEANFDLLNGIDFKKGCFVGQETTSRMKRRGVVKNRMAPITFSGPAPEFGEDLLAGALRAGEVRSGRDGQAMALLRLDRLDAGPLTLIDGRSWRPVWPSWLDKT